jgi:hypothetical protein
MVASGDSLIAAERRTMAARKVRELQEKLAGIGVEFDGWLADAKTGKPLRKHRTQIERLTNQLRGMVDDIDNRIRHVSLDDDDVMATCRQLQREMLEVHRLWDYFRSKLSLRYVKWFSDYLATADEFAWACYEPAQKAAPESENAMPRAGPLVFLSGDFSPFTYARETPFDIPDVPDTLDSKAFETAVASLPIPVIGVPWYQVAHLPDAVLIAHEVGHDVQHDFGLDETISMHAEAVLAAVDADTKFAWTNWLREVWADLYGVLAAGPAFVAAMRDLLVTNPREVIADAHSPVNFDRHPPAFLRIRVMTRALEKTGFGKDACCYRNAWNQAFPANGGGAVADVSETVADALLAGTFPELGDRRLGEVVSFSAAQQETAVDVKTQALADQPPQSGDIKSLVAGARIAFDANPDLYGRVTEQRRGAQRRIVERAVAAMGDKTRVREAETEISSEADRSAGLALFQRLIRGDVAE